MDDDDDTTPSLPPELERLVAGTFALMTTWYQCPQPAICHKVVENLSRISRHDAVSDALRRVCANASARWVVYLEEVEIAIGTDDEDDDDGCGSPEEPVSGILDAMPGPVTLH